MAIPNLKRYTYEDYLTWPDTPRQELVNGIPYLMSAPNRMHQVLSRAIFRQLDRFLEGKKCQVFYAPFDVRLYADECSGGDTVVQPDILVICDKNKLDDKGVKGAPELVVEILSPGSGKMDKIIKLNAYEQAGVLEYWLVDPLYKVVSVYLLKDGRFERAVEYSAEDTLPSATLPGCEIDLTAVFTEAEE